MCEIHFENHPLSDCVFYDTTHCDEKYITNCPISEIRYSDPCVMYFCPIGLNEAKTTGLNEAKTMGLNEANTHSPNLGLIFGLSFLGFAIFLILVAIFLKLRKNIRVCFRARVGEMVDVEACIETISEDDDDDDDFVTVYNSDSETDSEEFFDADETPPPKYEDLFAV